jgi:myo-inositol-1(or 4)-monophosphatase
MTGSEEILALARQIAREAGARILRLRRQATVTTKSSTNDLVTQADTESEALIRERVKTRFPDHAFYGEESAEEAVLSARHLWVVDPLDGTNNFAHGIPAFSVSIAYAFEGETQVAVVYDPVHDELFSAVRGEGAFLNGTPVEPSHPAGLHESIIATGFYYDRGEIMRRTLQALEKLFSLNIRGMRRFGSAALDICWVAAGRFEGYFEYKLATWDYAAAALIAQEAGLRCAGADGTKVSLATGSMVCSAPEIFDALIGAVRWKG